jgi:hypothetical protein
MGSQSEILNVDIQWQDLFNHQLNMDYLISAISMVELVNVVKSQPSRISPGPDSFPDEFYKKKFFHYFNKIF